MSDVPAEKQVLFEAVKVTVNELGRDRVVNAIDRVAQQAHAAGVRLTPAEWAFALSEAGFTTFASLTEVTNLYKFKGQNGRSALEVISDLRPHHFPGFTGVRPVFEEV
ncbi:hypothetical protein HGA91_03495 [candidate division WWE3 bacterium]|nr:hypothetical protein [candidate division WWE3 bacterium]